jgi:DNA-binding transcriptional ArsR family regulator
MGQILSNEIVSALEQSNDTSRELKRLVVRARQASDFLKALAHENRLLILCLLAERERSVNELEQVLSLSQPSVSQQLARLRLDGLVDTRREGRTVHYKLADDTTRQFIEAIYNKYCRDA